MRITIENLQKKIPLNLPHLKKIAGTILRPERLKTVELSIVFVTSQKIRALNKKFLKRTYTTDVLAFDLADEPSPRALIGEVIISTDAAIQNAKAFNTCVEHEVVLYVIHGILHLLGYDDHGKAETRKMRRKEAILLKKVERMIPQAIKSRR